MDKIQVLPLFSGSKGNSTLIIYKDTHILIDIGVAKSRIETKLREIELSVDDLDGILLTHSHSDHIKAVSNITARNGIKCFLSKEVFDSISSKASNSLSFEIFSGQFLIKGLSITPIKLDHDVDCHGFIFDAEGERFVYMTDLGVFDFNLLPLIKGALKVFVESNHDVNMLKISRYPYILKRRIMSSSGHLSNDDCGEICKKLYEGGTRKFILGHLSEENNSPEMAYDAVMKALFSVTKNEDYSVFVASREGYCGII